MEIFLEKARKYDLRKKIDIEAKKIDLRIISDYRAGDVDALAGAHIVADRPIGMSGFDLQKLFDLCSRQRAARIL